MFPQGNPAFVETRWTRVLNAGDPELGGAGVALDGLCRDYWYPLYSFIRRRGYEPEDAKDLTQGFFAELIEHNWIGHADPAKGRFRSFLLMALNRFLANEHKKARTLKRGGAIQFVPFDLTAAETRYCREPATTETPESVFDRQWALTILNGVLEGLGTEYRETGRGELFRVLKLCLIGSRETQPYAELAAGLKMSEGAVKVAVSRLRERYREKLREAVADTVASPAEVESELRHLLRVVARG